MEDQLSTAKLSADTVINETTGIPEVTPVSQGASDQPAMSIEDSKKQTALLMDMRESIQGMGFALLSDGNIKGYKRYSYKPYEKNMLIDAWNPIIQQHNIKVSPYLHILYAEAIATGPMVALAQDNRKQRLALEEAASIIRRKNEQIEELERRANGPAPSSPTLRADTKNQWRIDEKGYFENTRSGKYIPKNERTEKPDLSPEAYELLCKHNGGRDYVDKALGI